MDRQNPLWLTTFFPIVLLTSGNEQEVAAMEIGGNRRANAIFEARSSCVYTSIKPTSRSEHSSRMAFVQEKYMRRSFYDGSHYSFCVEGESSSPLKTYHQYEPLTPNKGSKPLLLSYENLFKEPSAGSSNEEEEEDEDLFGEAPPYSGSLMDAYKPQGNDSSTASFSLEEDDDDGDMFADSKTTTSELFGPSSSNKYHQKLSKLTKPIEGGLLCFLEKEEKPFGVINFVETTSPKKLKTKPKAKIGEPFGEEYLFSTPNLKKKGSTRPKVKVKSEEWAQFAQFGRETQVREKTEQKKPNYENNSRWRKKLSDCSEDHKDRRSEVRNALHSWLTSDDDGPEMIFHNPKQDPKQRSSWTGSPAARSAPNTSKRRNTYNGSRRSGIKSVPSSPKCPLTPEVVGAPFGFEVAEQTKKTALGSALEPQVDGFGLAVLGLLSVRCSPSLVRSRKSIQTDPGQKIDHFGVVAKNTGTPNSTHAIKRAFTIRQPSLQNFLAKEIPPPLTDHGVGTIKTGEQTVPPRRASSRRSASRRDSGDPSLGSFLSRTESSKPDSIGIQTGEPAPRRTSRRRSSRRESSSGSSLNDSCAGSSALMSSADTDEDMHPVHGGELPQTSSPRHWGATDPCQLEQTPPAPLTTSRRGRVRSSPPLAPSPTRSPKGVDGLAESGTLTLEPRRRRSKSRHDRSGHRRSDRSPRQKLLEDAPPTPPANRRRARTSALKPPLVAF
jgi:hypothetical protein